MVTVNVFNEAGVLQGPGNGLSFKVSLPPRSMRGFVIGNPFTLGNNLGWLEIIADGPVYPSGDVSSDRIFLNVATSGRCRPCRW